VGDKSGMPTILFDEIDTIFGPRAKENEDIRGLLNAGHRRGAVAGRCVVLGKKVVTEEIPAYCAVALAGLGGLPDTLLSRAIVIQMRRRAPNETVEPYRRRVHALEGQGLREQLAEWSVDVVEAAAAARPEMPEGVNDRDADMWEPLIALADIAGSGWPERARVAAVTLVTDSKASTPSLNIRLFADIKTVFGELEALSTVALLAGLNGLEESPWSEIQGKPLNSRGLGSRLGQYGVKSTTVRIGKSPPAKGYKRTDFADAWVRYLPNAL
jgi:Protein of unknown function (DUF3631)